MLNILTALGLGGIVGAVIALVAQSVRLREAFERFSNAMDTCLVGRDDEPSRNLRRRFEELQGEIGRLLAAVESARRALRIR